MTNIQQEIAELKKRLAELENRANSPQLEWPQVGDEVFRMNGAGYVDIVKFDRLFHGEKLRRGLIKPTKQEAENADKKRIAIAEWNRLAGDQSWINWSAANFDDGYKYYPFYNHVQKAWFIDSNEDWQVWPFAHHKSKADCEAAIADMGEKMNWLLY